MTWVKYKPVRAGYYWVRNYRFDEDDEVRKEPFLVYRSPVYFGEEPSFTFHGNDQTFPIMSGEFYGPIEAPKESE